MDLTTTTYIVVGLSFALYIGIAIWARAGSTSEFYVAGGGVHPVTNGMATAADWMSAASFISMAGLIAGMGYGGGLFLMGWTGGYVLLAMLLAPYLRKFGKFTVPQFIGDRFYSKTAATIAVVCLLTASITYIIGQMTGVGVAFSRFLEVSNATGIYVGMALVFVYAVFGGMKGITYTQVAQYIVLILAYTVPAVFISLQLTGNPIPQLGLGSNLVGTDVSLLSKLDQIVSDLGFAEYTTSVPGSKLNMFVYTLSLMIGTAGLPHVIMRFFTVPSVKDARVSAGWALIFIAALYTVAPAVGAMAQTNLMRTITPGVVMQNADPYAPEASIRYDERPDWMKRWETTGLLKFEDKNGDGRIQYYNDKTTNPEMKAKFDAAGWKGNELNVNADIMVMANPEIALLPNWVIALVAAGGLAAALSTADGLLLTIASALSHDVYYKIIRPQATTQWRLVVSKSVLLVVAVLAAMVASQKPSTILSMVAWAFSLAAAAFFPALVLGIFWQRANKAGAISGMLVGFLVTVYYVLRLEIDSIPWLGVSGIGMAPWFGIQSVSAGVFGVAAGFLTIVVVSLLGPPPDVECQRFVNRLRVPRALERER